MYMEKETLVDGVALQKSELMVRVKHGINYLGEKKNGKVKTCEVAIDLIDLGCTWDTDSAIGKLEPIKLALNSDETKQLFEVLQAAYQKAETILPTPEPVELLNL